MTDQFIRMIPYAITWFFLLFPFLAIFYWVSVTFIRLMTDLVHYTKWQNEYLKRIYKHMERYIKK